MFTDSIYFPFLSESTKNILKNYKFKSDQSFENIQKIEKMKYSFKDGELCFKFPSGFSELNKSDISQHIENLIPWRKGPISIGNLKIDSEWDSHKKLKIVLDKIQMPSNSDILDIGCNNGYYFYGFAESNYSSCLGIDPTEQYLNQYRLLNTISPLDNTEFFPLRLQDLV